MSLTRAKHYVDRAIQTDSCNPTQFNIQSLDFYNTKTGIDSFENDISLGVEKITASAMVGDSTELEAQSADSAYTQSRAVQYTISSRARKQLDIGSGRPSMVTSPEKRAVSLPVNSGAVDKRVRVVSMPEDRNLQSIRSGTLDRADLSDSIDVTYNSAEFCLDALSREGETERPYPADLPQTPSPPSSPDSIMIIANEGRVSGSFLRRSYADEAGWIGWASSPPRPIPALHGPLSLPYARCPSGAEGTVTEGDDLSNKIWGLGIDETQGQHSRPSKTLRNRVIPQQGSSRTIPTMLQPSRSHDDVEYEPPANSFPRERDAVIDLSKPLVFRNQGDLKAGSRYSYELDCRQVTSHSPITPDIILERPTLTKLKSQYPSPIDTYNPQRVNMTVHGRCSVATPLGLGLNFSGALQPLELSKSSDSSNVKHDVRTRLNTAAPAFVPASSAYTMQSNDSVGSLYARQRGRESKMNVASHETQQDYHLATSASTISPRWSPVFSYEPHMPDHMLTRNMQHNTGSYAPKVYSPQLDFDGYTSRLRAMMEQLGGLDIEYDNQRFKQHIGNFPSKIMPVPQLQSRKYFEYNNVSHIPHDLVFGSQKTPGFPEQTQGLEREIEQSPRDIDSNNLKISPERQRNLSYQHPRSIPLARLIQRRLSSVAEEDAIAQESLLPLLRKRAYQFPNQSTQSPQNASAEESIESVDLEDRLLCPEESSAIVKLPKKAKADVRSLPSDNKRGKKSSGSRKENSNAPNAHNTESVAQSRYRHRKSGTPPLQPTVTPTS